MDGLDLHARHKHQDTSFQVTAQHPSRPTLHPRMRSDALTSITLRTVPTCSVPWVVRCWQHVLRIIVSSKTDYSCDGLTSEVSVQKQWTLRYRDTFSHRRSNVTCSGIARDQASLQEASSCGPDKSRLCSHLQVPAISLNHLNYAQITVFHGSSHTPTTFTARSHHTS